MALEGVPALISINVEALQGAEPVQATAMAISGNVLDVAAGSDGVIISVDNIHVPGSTTNKRSEQVRPRFAQPGVRMQLTRGATGSRGGGAAAVGGQRDCDVGERTAGAGESAGHSGDKQQCRSGRVVVRDRESAQAWRGW